MCLGDKNMSTALEKANEAFQKVGTEYGYETVSVEFVAFKEFKVQWSRSYKYAHFRLSDYLKDAPAEAFMSLAQTIFAKISGKEEIPYGKAMRSWALSQEFSESKRPLYISRSKNFITDTKGSERTLEDSLERLRDMGLVEGDTSDIQMVWVKQARSGKAASCSVLMRLIAVSDALDDADIPDFVIDFAVYSQYLRIRRGAEVFGITGEVYTREDERRFEKYREAERMLDKLNMYL